MPAASWIQNVQLIQDLLDYVRARDTNRPLSQLAQRTQYLFEAIQEAQTGELLIARNVALDELTIPGSPVWFDTSDAKWKLGQAILEVASGNDFGFARPESEVKGVVLVKHTASTGDIALYGRIRNDVWGIDWDQVIDTGSLAAGRYYLSTTEGQITTSRNVLSVEIGTMDSLGNLVLTPSVTGNLRSHLHLRFQLEAVLGASLNDPGWVPVANFGGAGIPYPVGAIYGYNLTQNAALAAKFPPQPIDNYFMAYNGVGVHPDSLVVDENGIWWMNGTESPDNMGVHLYQSSETANYFEFWMTILNFGSKLVNSLQTVDQVDTIPIIIQDLLGAGADSGDLRIFLSQVLRIPELDDESDEGGYALKTVEGVKGVRGPVVNRIKAGPGISITGTEGTAADGRHGTLVISLSSALASLLRGQPSLVALDNAREDFYGEVPVLSLPQGRRSGFKMKIQVPDFLTGTYQAVINLGVVAPQAYNSQVSVSWMIVRPGSAVPSAATNGPAVELAVPTNQLTVFQTSAISGLLAGDILLVDIRRTSPPAQDIMLANLSFELSEVV